MSPVKVLQTQALRYFDWATDRHSDFGQGKIWNRFTWLLLSNIAILIGWTIWRTLLDNFAVERVAFTGKEIGNLHSLREIPGFLAFTAVFLFLVIKEQIAGVIMVALFGLGIALTGFLPSILGLYFTTVIMSIGFHYYETVNKSLTLQWLPKDRAPELMGRMLSVKSVASILSLVILLGLLHLFAIEYVWLFFATGVLILALAWLLHRKYQTFPQLTEQRKEIVLRKRYWLYYVLTFLSGARRQIFMVFAGFLLVEKFGFSVLQITMLYLVNEVAMVWLAPKIGKAIARFGERAALLFEYAGLILVFISYAFVESASLAAALYVIDHFFFGFYIAMQTYFQKIADPADMASSASVSFTINHIAAVFIPALFGIIWLTSPSWVFLAGAAMAALSLLCSLFVPRYPGPGRETEFTKPSLTAI